LPWAEYKIDVVVESTGIYKAKATDKKDGYDGHLKAGAKKVIITVPTKVIKVFYCCRLCIGCM
jgi:glyceraldehyde 3-phosphate dehydrogenase